MTISFIENMLCFGEKCSCLTFYDGIKMFIANKVLFTMTKEKPLALLTLVTAFIRRKCQDICENCQRHMFCKLANPLTKRTLFVIGQIQDGFSTLRNKCSSLVLKPCKSDQETSKEVLFIKARQNPFYRVLMLKLDRILTQAIFVENYEIRFSRSNYTHILEYLCRVSFLTTLDIYKDYFKGRHKRCKVKQRDNPCIL